MSLLRRKALPGTNLALTVLVALAAHVPAAAEVRADCWHARAPAYVTATLHYSDAAGSRSRRLAVSGLLELQLRYGKRPWTIGPVVEMNRAEGPRNNSSLNAGLIFRHAHDDWDTTALLFRHMPQEAPYTWAYGARLRYRVSDSGKVGAELFGSLERLDSPTLMLGYYGDISGRLSFRLLGGRSFRQNGARLGRAELVWQLH